MAKMQRKKKKDVDFQKVKLKIGRKLKRDSNETKAEFRSKKIILKELQSRTDDPLSALTRHSEHISQHGKLSLLNHFNSALTPDIVKNLNKPIVDNLAKFTIDHSDTVRTATYKCLKTCLNQTRQQNLRVKDFAYSLKPYLDCAYTHISKPIANDCLKFLEYLTNINEPQLFEPLMGIVLRRYSAGNLTNRDTDLAARLRNLYLKNKKRQDWEESANKDNVEPFEWSLVNYQLDMNSTIHQFCHKWRQDDEREVFLVPKPGSENIVVEEFLSKMQ